MGVEENFDFPQWNGISWFAANTYTHTHAFNTHTHTHTLTHTHTQIKLNRTLWLLHEEQTWETPIWRAPSPGGHPWGLWQGGAGVGQGEVLPQYCQPPGGALKAATECLEVLPDRHHLSWRISLHSKSSRHLVCMINVNRQTGQFSP